MRAVLLFLFLWTAVSQFLRHEPAEAAVRTAIFAVFFIALYFAARLALKLGRNIGRRF